MAAFDVFFAFCGLFCGVGFGLFLLAASASGRQLVSSPGAAPSSIPPRGVWKRRGWFSVFNQYERAVKLRFGQVAGEVGVGLRFRVPFIEEFLLVDIRDVPENIPGQTVITRDNVSIKVDGVVYWKVFQPETAVMSLVDPSHIIRQATMSTLRVVVGEFMLDDLLTKREVIAQRMEELLDAFSHPLGLDITRIDITDVNIPQDMQRAMAREAEAQRERRARLRRAEGEVEAVKNLAHAAHTLGTNPQLVELRRLQAVGELGMEQQTAITLVLPYDYGTLGGSLGDRREAAFSHEANEAFLAELGLAEDLLADIDDGLPLLGGAAPTAVAPATEAPAAPAPAEVPPAPAPAEPAPDGDSAPPSA